MEACTYETCTGAEEMAGARTAHVPVPQGPSHIALITGQPPKAMASGPIKTQMASANIVITRRELMT